MVDDRDDLSENEKKLYSDEAIKPATTEDVLAEPILEEEFLPGEVSEEDEESPPLGLETDGSGL
ncbi:MAG: hypothetical protein AAB597_00980 [Patescibacteria group bacterium]